MLVLLYSNLVVLQYSNRFNTGLQVLRETSGRYLKVLDLVLVIAIAARAMERRNAGLITVDAGRNADDAGAGRAR